MLLLELVRQVLDRLADYLDSPKNGILVVLAL